MEAPKWPVISDLVYLHWVYIESIAVFSTSGSHMSHTDSYSWLFRDLHPLSQTLRSSKQRCLTTLFDKSDVKPAFFFMTWILFSLTLTHGTRKLGRAPRYTIGWIVVISLTSLHLRIEMGQQERLTINRFCDSIEDTIIWIFSPCSKFHDPIRQWNRHVDILKRTKETLKSFMNYDS